MGNRGAEGKTIARSITPVNLVGSGASGWNTKSCQTYRAWIVRLDRRSGSAFPLPSLPPPNGEGASCGARPVYER